MKNKLLFFFLVFLNIGFCNTYQFLVYGGETGWIGQKVVKILKEQNFSVYCGKARLENRFAIEQEIDEIRPDFIINAAGLTGRPNVDWCEDHRQETIRANLIGALTLADVSCERQIHLTNFGTGCIYQYDEAHPIGSGIGFKEDDPPNFVDSFYSKTKAMLNDLLPEYKNVLNLRLRMPISSDLHPRSFITKIIHYSKVIDVPNSMAVLDDLLPIAVEMTIRRLKGHYNFVNPGTISHNEILSLYQKYVDPTFQWENFSEEEQNRILKAKRSNNEMDVTKLIQEFPKIPTAKESIEHIMQNLAHSK